MTKALVAALLATLALTPAALASAAQSESAWLTTTMGTPIECYPTSSAYAGAGGPADSAGFWGYSPTLNEPAVNLSRPVCSGLQELREGITGTTPSVAAFDLSHELAHATGADYAFETAHTNDAWFQSDIAKIAAKYRGVDAGREAAADCVGLLRSAAVAYMLGMRGHQAFAMLARFAPEAGYVRMPPECAAS